MMRYLPFWANVSMSSVRKHCLIGVEIFQVLGKDFGSHTRKLFDIANKMRLIIVVQGKCNIRKSIKLTSLNESYRFIKTRHPYITLGRNPDRLGESFFKLTF